MVDVIVYPFRTPGTNTPTPLDVHVKLVDANKDPTVGFADRDAVVGAGVYSINDTQITITLTPQDHFLAATFWEFSLYAGRYPVAGPYYAQLPSTITEIDFEDAIASATPVTPSLPFYDVLALAVMQIPAAMQINGHRAIALDNEGNAIHADYTTTVVPALQGVSLTAAIIGNPVTIATRGIIAWPAGSLTPGANLYMGENGYLVETEPTHHWLYRVGLVLDSTLVAINISDPIWLGE